MTAMNRDYVSPVEAAEITGLNEEYIRKLCRKGIIASSKVGRLRKITRKELDRFMSSNPWRKR